MLGPGNRFVIWVQGCLRNCSDCGSPEWRTLTTATLIKPEELADKILNQPDLEGITVSGGEPVLQAKNLVKMLEIILKEKNLGVICYTGYTLKELKDLNDENIDDFLKQVDVLIDGTYMEKLNDNKGWRGSANQKIHFLTDRYKEFKETFINRKRDIEIHLFQEHYLLVGVKPKGFKDL